ncbi:Fanconi complementation group D2 [Brachionus plicatilis]|uniref:Fanconi complementation group D2 n=1 Tax=Brachionus plicatilis TaxID=10195 RepID=A0A3M7QG00_BRAPC|nr:Fanconi complementation group D2 [Brachionus plicatilis]
MILQVALVLIIAMCLYLIVFKYQLFAKFEVKEIKFPTGRIIFTSYKGQYSKVGEKIKTVISDLDKYADFKNKKISHTYFGIYYDDPCRIVDPNESRAIVGIIIFSENLKNFNADEFINKFEEKSLSYQTKSFQEFKSVGAKFPLFNFINIMSGIFRGYPAIKKYAKNMGILENFQCSLEIYDYKNKELTISFPYESESDLLWLSGYPVPVYKDTEVYKTK